MLARYPIVDALGFGHMYYKNPIMRNIGTYPLFEKVMKELPFGAIIATAELVGCFPIVEPARIEDMVSTGKIIKLNMPVSVHGREYLFGDWTPGRYAWELRNVKMLAEPIPAKGKQRLWYFDMPDEII